MCLYSNIFCSTIEKCKSNFIRKKIALKRDFYLFSLNYAAGIAAQSYFWFFLSAGNGRGVVLDLLPAAEARQGRAHPRRPDGPAVQVRRRERQRQPRRRRRLVRVPRAAGTAAGYGRHNRVQQLQEPVGYVEPEGERAGHRQPHEQQLRRRVPGSAGLTFSSAVGFLPPFNLFSFSFYPTFSFSNSIRLSVVLDVKKTRFAIFAPPSRVRFAAILDPRRRVRAPSAHRPSSKNKTFNPANPLFWFVFFYRSRLASGPDVGARLYYILFTNFFFLVFTNPFFFAITW